MSLFCILSFMPFYATVPSDRVPDVVLDHRFPDSLAGLAYQPDTAHCVSVSGGKDSTATLLLAKAVLGPDRLRAYFCDTGHEHPDTLSYIETLSRLTDVPITTVRPDFSDRFARRREYIANIWPEKGVPARVVEQALAIMAPTGNPFLDLCLLKGRFPSVKARFCTEELKVNPLLERHLGLIEEGHAKQVIIWQGLRKDESRARSNLEPVEDLGAGIYNYRPILDWKAEDTFAFAAACAVPANPLYRQGMARVGCMPCIMVRKDELAMIARRFPAEIDRVRQWEALVSQASKLGGSTLLHRHGVPDDVEDRSQIDAYYGIDATVDWSLTAHGGRQVDLLKTYEPLPACSSAYGLCE